MQVVMGCHECHSTLTEPVALPSHLSARRLGILRPIGARLHPTHIRGRPRCVVERIEGMDALDESAIALGIKPGPIGCGLISDGPKFIIYFIALNEGGRKNNAKHQRKPWFMGSAIVLDPNSCRCRLMLRSTPKKENTAVPVDVQTSTCHHFHIFIPLCFLGVKMCQTICSYKPSSIPCGYRMQFFHYIMVLAQP